MKLFFSLVTLLCSVVAVANFIDHGDCTLQPEVNVKVHLHKIARHYMPDTSVALPKGLPREVAWEVDIYNAAKSLNINRITLEDFMISVIDTSQPFMAAPHAKLLEFELYSKGCRELQNNEYQMPSAWQQLLALPKQQRLYCTIPVLYCDYINAENVEYSKRYEKIKEISQLRLQGFHDTQGCERSMIMGLDVYFCRDAVWKIRFALLKYGVEFYDMDKGIGMYQDSENNNIPWIIYCLSNEELAELAQKYEDVRDIIVALGLTNRELSFARTLAFRFASQSPINTEIWALELSPKGVETLLGYDEEYNQLLDFLELKSLHGRRFAYEAERYIARYPDYAGEMRKSSSIIFNTHAELSALAGVEYLKAGDVDSALECLLQGCTPEDIGMATEQLLSVDELRTLCQNNLANGVEAEQNIYSANVYNDSRPDVYTVLNKDEINYTIRNILARRLMREQNYTEAKKWFTGEKTIKIAEQFFCQQDILVNEDATKSQKLAAALNIGVILREHGDTLFATFLEPDNLICHGKYGEQYGLNFATVKYDKQKNQLVSVLLNKPDLPRFHYRWITADYYRLAATLTDDIKLKSFCYWMAGSMIKYRDPKRANEDFKNLPPNSDFILPKENWFMPFKQLKNMDSDYEKWYNQKQFDFRGAL